MVWASAWPAPNSRISQNFAPIGDFFSALAAARPARRWPGPVELVDIGIDGDCREQIAWRPRGVGPALGVVAVFAIVRASSREHESERRGKVFFESAMVGMAMVSLDKQWVAVNPALCRILGIQPSS